MTAKTENRMRKVTDNEGFPLVEACEMMLGIEANPKHHWSWRLIRVLVQINYNAPTTHDSYQSFVEDLRFADATDITNAVIDFKNKHGLRPRHSSVELAEPCEVNDDAGKTISYTAHEHKVDKTADSATLPGWGDW